MNNYKRNFSGIYLNEGYLITRFEKQDISEVQLMGSSSTDHLVHGKKKTSVTNWTARDEGDAYVTKI